MNLALRYLPKARIMMMAIAAVLGAILFGTCLTAPAHAWAWDPTVKLGGKVGCTYSTRNTVQWAWVSGSDGESGWATLGSGGMTRP